MKKLLILAIVACLFNASFATTTIKKPKLNAAEVFLPVGKNGERVSLLALSRIDAGQFSALTGKQLKFSEKIGFKLAQRRLKKSINNNGTINNRKLERYLARSGETGFHAGGFFLGFFAGLIGVVIAYVINDDYKRNRVKWAWIGWGVWILIWLALLLSGAFDTIYDY